MWSSDIVFGLWSNFGLRLVVGRRISRCGWFFNRLFCWFTHYSRWLYWCDFEVKIFFQLCHTRQFIQRYIGFSRFKAVFLHHHAVLPVAFHWRQDVNTWVAPDKSQYFPIGLFLVQFYGYPSHQLFAAGVVGCAAQVHPRAQCWSSNNNGGANWYWSGFDWFINRFRPFFGFGHSGFFLFHFFWSNLLLLLIT